MKGIFTLGACMLVTFSLIIPGLASTAESFHAMNATMLFVGGSGPGNFTTIQSALDASHDGDMIFVYDDSSPYRERLEINTSVQLIGEDVETTIIEGDHEPYTINIMANNVTVHGFTILGSLELGEANCCIDGNRFEFGDDYRFMSIVLWAGSGNVISNNIIRNAEVGIGIFSGGSGYLKNNTIRNNLILSSKVGVDVWGYTDGTGVYIYAENNTFYNNTMIDNNLGFRTGDLTRGNFISHNNFLGNAISASSFADNWTGNYWSNYSGVDADHDGIGDTPYEIPGGMKDIYPFMLPVHNSLPVRVVYVNPSWMEDEVWHIWNAIQSGVDDATGRSVVFVFPGTYAESVNISLPLSLIGNRTGVVIDGGMTGDGIQLVSDGISVMHVSVVNASCGFFIGPYAKCEVISCAASDCLIGMRLFGRETLVSKCVLTVNSIAGLIVENNTDQDMIRCVNLTSNKDGIIIRPLCNNAVIRWCSIVDSSQSGVSILGPLASVNILENQILNNIVGVDTVSSRGHGLASIFHNNFIGNGENARDQANNTWDGGYMVQGNYWDDYTGNDTHRGRHQTLPGSDGIGDSPYAIAGGISKDQYPLMTPWANLRIDVQSYRLRGVKALITYTGPEDELTTEYTITVQGGFTGRINRTFHDFTTFWRNTPEECYSYLVFGFGPVTVTVHVASVNAEKTVTGWQFLFATII